ncbi:hypothetical protein Poli38472_004173 [Pythium oligandrum]|uniref:Inositol-3,4-bisphosphate 4-phosphatase n=1 Tax=Pythium oligandrum TaxID=41045 RepID=A0A8K1CP07_PYTOL|nr:hypothetical protein Poli38472_004173 [Pythium oligandrum]|eukprot:TMW66408.1 hypothetical protein Poli38472_004173 [Pythium oligandrum]
MTLPSVVVAVDPFPAQFNYECNKDHKCLFSGTDGATYSDSVECMRTCGSQDVFDHDLSENPTFTVGSDLNGTCRDCAMVVNTTFDFPALFATYAIKKSQLKTDECKFKSEIELTLPPSWTFADGEKSKCYIGDHDVPCLQADNKTYFTLDEDKLGMLMTPPKDETAYTFKVDQVSTRPSPGKYPDETTMRLRFDSTGCLENGDANQQQAFSLAMLAKSYELRGMFTETSMKARNPVLMGKTVVELSFRSGALLDAGCFFLLRVAGTLEPLFGELIQDVHDGRLIYKGLQYPLDVTINTANISFTIPDDFNHTIDNGDQVMLSFDGFLNPQNDSVSIEKLYLSAFKGQALAVDNSVFSFYNLDNASRSLKAAGLDVVSAIIFGICFLLSLVIIRWHGLPLTMTTLWTDMVAISALLSFATGCGGYLVWAIKPSKAYVYWYASQYFFNMMMVLSLCFHWAAVLAFKAFKKLTFKSPVVLLYLLVNVVVAAFIIIICVSADDKLVCVFESEAPACTSELSCSQAIAAGGQEVRHSVRTCKIQNFYLVFAIGIVTYTVMLMVLGCMVMSRGRSLMLNEDSDSRIRQSLTIFYIILATTIVLYISAQVIYITQYVSTESTEVSDLVWYIFIIWLPQGLPPMLLLFLQWNPRTQEQSHEVEESMVQSSKDDVFNMTPRSSISSPNLHYSKLFRTSLADSMLNSDEPGNKLRLIVRLKLPAMFDRACFVSLDYCSSKAPLSQETAIRQFCRSAVWRNIGTTEPVGVGAETEAVVSNGVTHAIFPFVAVLEVPMVGPASSTLLRFLVHASTLGKTNNYYGSHGSSGESGDSNLRGDSTQLSYQMTMFQPLLEFVSTSQAVLDAAASGQPLNIYPSDDTTCTVLQDAPGLQAEVDRLLAGNMRNAELSVQTVMMPGEDPTKDDLAHKNIGNIIRFFQYDSEDGSGGLVVEDLQESKYANAIPRQLIELIAVERQEQVEKAREDLNTFLNQKKDKQNRGFYGTLIGQIQDEGDAVQAKDWLESRVRKRKEYVALLRKNIQYLVNRDKHKQYFKASVEKKSDDLRFVPINLHIQDLLIGPTKAFINEEKRRASKEVSTYEFTTFGAPAAHVYKFSKGGILSFQTKLKKAQTKIEETELDLAKWPEEVREYDDLQWDLQLRMDCCLAQAMAALTCAFVRKVEVAIQNPDTNKGEDILRQLSTLGFLFQIESLLSTHGKEIGMIEDMAGSVAQLSCVAFVVQDVKDKPSNRFSFRMSRKKDVGGNEDAAVVKVSIAQKNERDTKRSHIKYVITVQVVTAEVELPDRLASGGEISVTPLLFTHGINEMQTIANNTERAKTELQDMININNLRPLKQFCEKYCRLAVAMPSMPSVTHTNMASYARAAQRGGGYKSMNQAPARLTEDQVMQDFRALETAILEAAQSLVKTKRPEILQRSADLCRELGAGRVTICKSAKDRTAMSVTLEQVRILARHHDLPAHRIPATVSVMRSHGVRIENALKNTGKRMFAFNKLQRSLLPEEYRCPDQVGGAGNVS